MLVEIVDYFVDPVDVEFGDLGVGQQVLVLRARHLRVVLLQIHEQVVDVLHVAGELVAQVGHEVGVVVLGGVFGEDLGEPHLVHGDVRLDVAHHRRPGGRRDRREVLVPQMVAVVDLDERAELVTLPDLLLECYLYYRNYFFL